MGIPAQLVAQLASQDDVVTAPQAFAAGLTRARIRTLLGSGWTRPTRGVLVGPDPRDPFRTSVRVAQLGCPSGAACLVTAARLHELWLLHRWTPAERPHLLLPAGVTYAQRTGMRLHSGLLAEQQEDVNGLAATTIDHTVHQLAVKLRLDAFVCLLDSALAKGWRPATRDPRRRSVMPAALLLADGRSESPLETLLRLLLVRAGLVPEQLQHAVFRSDGSVLARLDLAWPSLKLAIEADGRKVHDAPKALYGDRRRANSLELLGWTILRFTWADVTRNPTWVVDQVQHVVRARGNGR